MGGYGFPISVKIAALHRAAAAYLAQCRVRGEVEFDLLAIDMFADGSYDVRFIRNVAEFNWWGD